MRIPYRRRPSPVPNATNGRKEKSIACSECHNCQKRGAQCKKRSPGCRLPLGDGLWSRAVTGYPYTRKAPYIAVKCFSWSGKRGSDPRPQPWQGCALPTELFPQYNPVPRGWDYKGTEFFLNCKLFLNFFVRVCSRVAEYGFAVFAVYHNLAVLAYFTFKDFLCKLVDQLSLNQSFDRTGTIFRIVAVLYHVVFKRFRE